MSRRSMDATLDEDGSVQHIRTTGLHRTESENTAMDRLHEMLTGGRIEHAWSWGTLGMTGWKARYSKKIEPNDPVRYHYNFSGDENHVLGMDYDLYFRRVNLFGEIARSRSKGCAFIGSSIIDMGRSQLVFSYRRFDPRFQNPRSHSFCSSQVSNEVGVYWGFRHTMSARTRLSFYYDTYKKPWRTYSIPVPTRGDDLFIQVDQKMSSTFSLALRARFQHREIMQKDELNQNLAVPFLQNRHCRVLRFELRYRPSPALRMKSRCETVALYYPEVRGNVSHPASRESGFLFYQDIGLRLHPSVNISARWISFNTDSYDSRLYEFEGDLPGVLNIRPLYGKGHRWYGIIRWKIDQHVLLSLKGAVISYDTPVSLDTEQDFVEENTQKQIGIQLDFEP